MDTTVLLLIVIIALVVIVGWLLYERRKSAELRSSFGPEYQRTVEQAGSRRAAEAELTARRRRVASLSIRPLPTADRDRYAESWRQVQSRFVDEPSAAISEADGLIRSVMEARGYPMTDFDQRAADISVDHPRVVEHYRAAHAIATEQAGRTGQDTEALRQAMVHYRALFLELLGQDVVDQPQPATSPDRPTEPQLNRRTS
jgi:hypothetical protein